MADELNFQVAAEGFGSYLDGIIPKDIAIAAGAFSATMQQIKNIDSIEFEKFAQVAVNIETTKGLDLVNGTDVPTNLELAEEGHYLTALGLGPDGTYTMSDFFGCMSGLPYMWRDLQSNIINNTTTKLTNIYHELFLAVTWERAEVSITQTKYNVEIQPYIPPTYDTDPLSPTYGNLLDPGQPRIDDWYYTVSSSLTQDGGGYGRGNAPAPLISFSPNNCGASATCTIGTNNQSAASLGGGTFGRVTSYSFNAGTAFKYTTTSVNQPGPPSAPAAPVEYVTIQSAPTAALPVQSNGQRATGGTNSAGTTKGSDGSTTILEAGWPSPMNGVVQGYINQANTEIANIKTLNPLNVRKLNIIYNAAGLQLMREQRARFTAIPPVPSPTRDIWLNLYPTSLYVFVDAIPSLAQNTLPHMSAQTLEAISDFRTPGGQSVVAMMRQERNATRLQEIGIELDNNIPGVLPQPIEELLITNGTVATAIAGIPVTGINGSSTSPITEYTLPSTMFQENNTGNIISPIPKGYTDPNSNNFIVTGDSTLNPNLIPPITNVLDPNNGNVIDEILNTETLAPNGGNVLGPSGNGTGPNNTTPGIFNRNYPSRDGASTTASTTASPLPNLIAVVRASAIFPPTIGSVLDNGRANFPGSFAGSNYKNLIPSPLNTTFTSIGMLPSDYSVNEAIEQVIECNCTCWVD